MSEATQHNESSKVSAEQAIEDLKIALPYVRHAIEKAAKEGLPKMGILAELPDGSGRIVCRFDTSMIDAICIVIGLPPQTEDDRANAAAREFLQTHGLS